MTWDEVVAIWQERLEARTRDFDELRDREPHDPILPLPIRQYNVPGCLGCRFTGHPPHDASSGCESGGRPHCTCNTCF